MKIIAIELYHERKSERLSSRQIEEQKNGRGKL
jgi:hypothetical protein